MKSAPWGPLELSNAEGALPRYCTVADRTRDGYLSSVSQEFAGIRQGRWSRTADVFMGGGFLSFSGAGVSPSALYTGPKTDPGNERLITHQYVLPLAFHNNDQCCETSTGLPIPKNDPILEILLLEIGGITINTVILLPIPNNDHIL